MRLFIAIKVPQQLHRYCTQLQSQFPDIKNAYNFHITIQFLGNEIDKDSVNKIIDILKKIEFRPFDIQIGNALRFPDRLNTKGVWIECEKSDAVMNFASKIRSEMEKIGLTDDYPFKPHITLGRYKNLPQELPNIVRCEPHLFTVDEFCLMESKLTLGESKYKTVAKLTSN